MFIGRRKELEILERKIRSDSFEFGLIYGRRRVGKTRLLQELVTRHNGIYYVANEMGYEYNLKMLSVAIASYYKEPVTFDSYERIFQYLANRSREGNTILVIDEFTYLLSENKELLSVFQNSVDQYLLNSKVKLILSGSQVGMIEDAISYKKPLYGRTTFKIKVEPFDYYEAAMFYPGVAPEDKIRLYSIFGGIPHYTNKIDETKSVKENVLRLIVEEGSIFEDEIMFFLSQEVRSIASYGKILNAIASGATRLSEISTKSGMINTGTSSKYVDLLMRLGIVEKEVCFGEKAGSKKTIYRIKDQLFRFHYNFIEKNKSQRAIMEPDLFYETKIKPHFEEYVSQQFEGICRDFLKRKFESSIEEVGRYWYNDAKKKEDVEIDIVMQTEKELFAFECKWTKDKIGSKTVKRLEEKMAGLGEAKLGFFSKSGYESTVMDKGYALYTAEDIYR